MKVMILYRPQSEHERKVLDFQREFLQRTGHSVEMVSLDTRDGDFKARSYDITQYPAIVVVDEQGVLQKLWMGDMLPLINEVSFYTNTAGAGGI